MEPANNEPINRAAGSDLPTPPPTRRGRPELVGLGLLGVVLLTVGILPKLRQHDALAQGMAEQRQDVRTPTVEIATLPLVAPTAPGGDKGAKGAPTGAPPLILPASIQAIEETAINARTTGYLAKRFVDIGSRVQAGQLLADIESPDVDQQLSQAQADSAKSRAGTSQAIADSARLQAGVAQSAADAQKSRAGLEQARAAYKRSLAVLAQAKVAVASAEAKVKSSEQAVAGRVADSEELKAQLVQDKADRERWLQLGKEGAVAQQTVDTKETAYNARVASINSSDAAIQAAKADLNASQQAVDAARANVDAARADVATAAQQVQAAQSQVTSSLATLAAARASAQSGVANVQAANAQVQSSEAGVRRYAVLRDFEKVTAPFTGIITARNVDNGALIQPPTSTTATPLFTLARTDVLRILVNVPQSYVRSIRPGEKVDVLVREFGGKPFEGTVFSTTGALDPNSRTLLTEIHVPNKSGVLLPGMYAQVRFAPKPTDGGGASAAGLPRIPAEALISDSAGTRVASVTPDNKVHFLPVTISRDYGTTLEVGDGLKGTEHLILNPSDDLQEGESVHPVVPAPPAAPGAAGGGEKGKK